ncbi:hypothetical protein Tco_0522691 [Tanacetum coccineum]
MDSNEKQQLFAQKVQQQNTILTSQLELSKERVRVLENIKEDNNYLNEFLEADRKAKHFNQQAQSQFIRDQDIIRDLKQQRKMGSNEETRHLAQDAEKQQLFAQKVQQQNTNLTTQLEMYKERVRILEGINKDNKYLNEFLEDDEWAKRYNRQARSQFVRDRDIIRDLEKQ